MTSSSFPSPAAFTARCRPLVPELTATAYRAPTCRATARSNSPSLGPSERCGVERTSSTARFSVSVMAGLARGIGLVFIGIGMVFIANDASRNANGHGARGKIVAHQASGPHYGPATDAHPGQDDGARAQMSSLSYRHVPADGCGRRKVRVILHQAIVLN